MAKVWSKKWLEHVNPQNVTLYPLQLANCDRLEKNKAVYIFDEVGSGKTVSAGLMALHYMYNNPNARVLVITTSQLSDKEGENQPGPFKQTWLNKLPFGEHLADQIKVINYDYRNIKKVNSVERVLSRNGYMLGKNNWDLVIIDEAHVFLNSKTKRYKELVGGEESGCILAQKVVFLTATPIKESLSDLAVYSNLAWRMTHPCNAQYGHYAYHCFDDAVYGDTNTILAPKTSSRSISPEDLICARFDSSLPFTRYFKDTIRAINPNRQKKSPPVRRLAKVWRCSRENRLHEVLDQINALYMEAPERNRFVIFVRWIKENPLDPECSSNELEAYFLANEFTKWEEGCKGKSVEVVTGANRKPLSNYRDSDPSNLPTVLIINYQIGEQGVNLPGYNHVINYHIPASPAALEQRFGRIDRLDSDATEINVYYPLLDDDWDSSRINFNIAVSTYLKQMLPVLPSRNSILTEAVLDVCEKSAKEVQELAHQIQHICGQWKSDAPWERILNHLDQIDSDGKTGNADLMPDELAVARFVLGAKRPGDGSQSERIDRLKKICNDRVERIRSISGEGIELVKDIIRGIGDQIFYYTGQAAADMKREKIIACLEKISPIGDDGCAGFIERSEHYKAYIKENITYMRQGGSDSE